MAGTGSPPPESEAGGIVQTRALPYEDFVRHHLIANQPVLIQGALRQWKALDRWSPAFFKAEFGDRSLRLPDRQMTVSEFVDRVTCSTYDDPAPYLIAASPGRHLADLFPELLPDVEPVPEYLLPNWLDERCLVPKLRRELERGPKAELYFGGRGSGFPVIHWDKNHFHAFAGQVYGEKHWHLFPPNQDECLYPKQNVGNQSRIDNVLSPDLGQFPRFADATRYDITIRAGDLLFVPAGWWHVTTTPGPSISVSRNSANASNWRSVRSDIVKTLKSDHPTVAPLVDAYLWAVEKAKTRRDRKVAPGWS